MIIFPSLPSKIKNSIKFIYANINPTLIPVFDTHTTSSTSWLVNNPNFTMLKLAIFLSGTDMAEIRENKINTISNNTVYNQPKKGTFAPSNCIPVVSNSTTTVYNKLSNTTIVSNNITSNIPNRFNKSNNNLSNVLPPLTQEDQETTASRRSTRNKANQVDYKKFL